MHPHDRRRPLHRITIQYGEPADRETFDDYYRRVHVPIALTLPGLRSYTITHPRGLGSATEVHMVAELWFDDAEALTAALKSSEMAAAARDAGGFNVASMTMFSGEVHELRT